MPKLTILGAGSASFTKKFLSDAVLFEELTGLTISLMDSDEERLENARLLAQKLVSQAGKSITVEASTDRRAALAGADYVINITMIGGLACRQHDVDVPLKHGVNQAIGCTMGPGGVMAGLRAIPFMVDVAADMAEVCPGAWMLNYHNPQSATAQVWSQVSRVRYAGLCHGVAGACSRLAGWVGCTDMSELRFVVAGINHLAWVLTFEWKGEDAYPLLRERMEDPEVYWQDNVGFELLRHFGYYGGCGASHTSEYLPYFCRTPDMLRQNRITVRQYVDGLERSAAGYAEAMSGELAPGTAIDIRVSDEPAMRIVRALAADDDVAYGCHVSVVNHGLIENLPEEAGVEVPAVVDANGIRPEPVGKLPPQLAALTMMNLNVQQALAQAVLEPTRELAIQAVMVDPLTASVLELGDIRRMMDELIGSEAPWLPDWLLRPPVSAIRL